MPDSTFLPTARSYASVAEARNRDAVREQVRSCLSCPFAYNGNGPVLPAGPTPNDIMVIGEAPTRSDDRLGSVSHKGDPSLMLRRLLARVEIDLDQVFFANAIQCWPDGGILDRHLIACHSNLKALIGICDPVIVLALGSTAMKVTADRKGMTVTKHHGIPYTPRAGAFMGRVVFPTWHPAAIKHTASAEAMLAADIVEFARLYREIKDERG